jgi:hypothetical protein
MVWKQSIRLGVERGAIFSFTWDVEASRVEIASIHFEGEAVQWYDWFESCHGISSTWAEFEEGLLVQFGPLTFENINDELAKI